MFTGGTLGTAEAVGEDAAFYGRPCADARRDRALRSAGYRVVRFTAAEVLRNLPAVVARIRAAITARE